MFIHSATCDVPIETLQFLTSSLHHHRRAHDLRPHQQAGKALTQAKLLLRGYRDGTRVAALARDHRLSQAAAYRYLTESIEVLYLTEGIEVLATTAPDLHEAIEPAKGEGLSHLMLDGTVIPTDRLAEPTAEGDHAWYPGKHKWLGGKIQARTNPTGFPLRTSPVAPGPTHDTTAARRHCPGALHPAAAAGLPTLADKGYHGAGIWGAHPDQRQQPGGR